MGIEAARIRQEPYRRVSHRFLLQTDRRSLPSESDPICLYPKYRKHSRPVTQNLSSQVPDATPEFLRRQLGGRGSRPGNHIGHAVSKLKQPALFVGREQLGSEARVVQRRPESVSRTGEVMTDRSGVEAGIDPTEHDIEMLGYYIRDPFPAGRLEFCDGRARPGGAGGDWANSGRAGGEDWA